MLSQFVAGGSKHILCESTGRRHLEVCAGFLWILPHVPFPFADFALDPLL